MPSPPESPRPASVLKAIGLMAFATACAAGMNILVKQLSIDLHPYVIVFFRSLFGLIVLLPLLLRSVGMSQLKTKRLKLHFTRSFFHLVAMLANIFAIGLAPLAKVVAIKFSGPLFASILAIIWLRERIHARRATALLFGFAGMLSIVQPGALSLEPGIAFAVISSASWAFMAISIKFLSRTESSISMTIYMSLMTTALALLLALGHWQQPNLEQFALLLALGLP